MKKDKELIEEIVNRLKAQHDLPYKEGAWERFKEFETKTVSTPIKHIWKRAALIAAGLVVAGFVGYVMIKKSINDNINIYQENKVYSDLKPKINTESEEVKPIGELDQLVKELPVYVDIDGVRRNNKKIQKETISLAELEYATINLDPTFLVHSNLGEIPVPVKFNLTENSTLSKKSLLENSSTIVNNSTTSNGMMSHSSITHHSLDNNISQKSFKYSDKFSLGLFVAPNSTSDNLKVGAGLTVTYNINKRISIRTGASYNTYEVGVLKNPLSPASVETVNVPLSYNDPSASFLQTSSSQLSKMSLPNINAVSGFVESIEIPLEMKYNLSKSFYAAAGISYSTIINQERNAQYVENIDMVTFKHGFPNSEKEAAQAMKVVTKTVKSSENNVNTNGYNGFVNLSIGKKVKINSKFGVALEPYFKIPVGEFRRSDMNYNNGGVRIMTTF